MAQLEGGKEKDAVITFNKVLELDPANAKACIKKGEAFTALGDYKMALTSYEQGAKIDDNNEKIRYAMGDVYFLSEQYNEAIEQFSKKPDYAYAYNDRGSSYRQLEEYTKAVADYNKAAQLEPKMAFIYNNIGAIKKKQKRLSGCHCCLSKGNNCRC